MTTTSESCPQGSTPIDIAAPVPWVASDAPMPDPNTSVSMVVDAIAPPIEASPPGRVTLQAVTSEWADSLGGTVRNHPMVALAGALVLGAVLGRAIR